MAWVTPKTWVSGMPLTADDLNTQVRDNLSALKAPPTACVVLNEAADYVTTSTVFVDIDSSRLNLPLTTTGGDLLIGFSGNFFISGSGAYLDVTLDGVRIAGDDGMMGILLGGHVPVTLNYLKCGVPAGAHTLKLQWKLGGSGAATLYAGAGTGALDLHAIFWAREI